MTDVSTKTIDRVLLDKIASLNPKPGQAVPVKMVTTAVEDAGFGAADVQAAIKSMASKGYFKQLGMFLKISQECIKESKKT
jgi:hypothetical protein